MKKAPPIRYGPSLSAGYLPYLSNKKILQENREMQKTSKSEIEIDQRREQVQQQVSDGKNLC
jgi:hypothetical protein